MTYVDRKIRSDPKALADHQRSILAALKASLATPVPAAEVVPVANETERCFCGRLAEKLMVSDDELDELLLCSICYTTLTHGYSLRASFADVATQTEEPHV